MNRRFTLFRTGSPRQRSRCWQPSHQAPELALQSAGVTSGQAGDPGSRPARRWLLALLTGLLLAYFVPDAGAQSSGSVMPFKVNLGVEGSQQPEDLDLGIRILFTITLLSLAGDHTLLDRMAGSPGLLQLIGFDSSHRMPYDFVLSALEGVKSDIADCGNLQVSQRALLLQLAAIAWRQANGKLPARLDELAGPYFQSLPLDPWNGATFGYVPDGLTSELEVGASPSTSAYRVISPAVPFLWSVGEANSQGEPLRRNKDGRLLYARTYAIVFTIP